MDKIPTLVERLRDQIVTFRHSTSGLCSEAADEIERLQRRVSELEHLACTSVGGVKQPDEHLAPTSTQALSPATFKPCATCYMPEDCREYNECDRASRRRQGMEPCALDTAPPETRNDLQSEQEPNENAVSVQPNEGVKGG